MKQNVLMSILGLVGRLAIVATLLLGFNAQATTLQTDNCLFNWAESNYPSLFAPAASATLMTGVYTYRHYPVPNTYLGVSSADNNVYYIGPDAVLKNVGPLSDWLARASCPAPAPPQVNCLFDWAERSYPTLFFPVGFPTTVSGVFTYRYYPSAQAWLWVSSTDNHVYYIGPDGSLRDEGALIDWLPFTGCMNTFAKPSYPVIFIHGLNSSALTWAEPSASLKNFLTSNGGWTFGGSPSYDFNTKQVNGILGSGDYYTVDFSGNPYQGLDVRGSELSAIIQTVLANNPDKAKVILVGHSMGGLVAREYLQGLSKEVNTLSFITYRGDVDKLITVGTPHQGSYIAEICLRNQVICGWLGYDPSSQVIADLKPGSAALDILNNLQVHPLPSTVSYFSIIGRGVDTISSIFPPGLENGDFIVTANSQDLSTLNGAALVHPQPVTLNILERGVCNNQSIAVLHLCETGDLGVWEAILLDL